MVYSICMLSYVIENFPTCDELYINDHENSMGLIKLIQHLAIQILAKRVSS